MFYVNYISCFNGEKKILKKSGTGARVAKAFPTGGLGVWPKYSICISLSVEFRGARSQPLLPTVVIHRPSSRLPLHPNLGMSLQ